MSATRRRITKRVAVACKHCGVKRAVIAYRPAPDLCAVCALKKKRREGKFMSAPRQSA